MGTREVKTKKPKRPKRDKKKEARSLYALKKEAEKIPTRWNNAPSVTKDLAGFVYLVENICTGRKYIGKKVFWEKRKGKKIKESNWKYYKGSNAELLKEYLQSPDAFVFHILNHFKTRREVNYNEVKEQFKRDVLEAKLDAHIFEFYNSNICAKWFRGNL